MYVPNDSTGHGAQRARFAAIRTSALAHVAGILQTESDRAKRRHGRVYTLQGTQDYGDEYRILQAFHAELVAELDGRRNGERS